MNLKLPDKLSDCVELGLEDLEKVEQDPFYEVTMTEYHYMHDGICHVCLAGAIMAKTIKLRRDETFHDIYVTDQIAYSKLEAVSDCMFGELQLAGRDFGIPDEIAYELPKKYGVEDYNQDPVGFKKSMEGVIAILRAQGW